MMCDNGYESIKLSGDDDGTGIIKTPISMASPSLIRFDVFLFWGDIFLLFTAICYIGRIFCINWLSCHVTHHIMLHSGT